MITCKNSKCKNSSPGGFHFKGNFIPAGGSNEYKIVLMCLRCMWSFAVQVEVKEGIEEVVK